MKERKNNKMISIIVPCFNEEEGIEKFYIETKKVIDQINNEYDYELLFIDDGSKDETLNKVKK